jgi:hypothetical protein
MTTQFECVNCGRFYAADKLPKCPVCSASGPIVLDKSNLSESESSRNYVYLDAEKTPFWVYIARVVIVALILLFIIAFLHDLFTGQLPGGGGGYEDSEYPGFERR